MKKLLKAVGAVALATLAFFMVSCDYNITNDNNGIVTLGTPNVKGKAYPGVNYVYWEKVANDSKGYDYYVYEDGVLQNSSPIHTTNNYILDTDLQYDVKKEYKIWATGDRAARTAFFQEGDSGSVSLTPILPPYSTTPTELAKYEDGYDDEEGKTYELSEDKEQYQLSSSTVTVTPDTNNTGKFTVTFPAKAYLSYTIYADKGNKLSIFDEHEIEVATYQNFAINDKLVTLSGQITTAGEYTITVKASAVNTNYVNSEEIVSGTKLTYAAYEISGTSTASNIVSKYTNGTTVRIAWTPVKDTTGTILATSNYKIYRTISGSTTYEEVSGTINSETVVGSSTPTYYFDDTVSGTDSYVYTFVVTDGTNISKYATTYSIAAYEDTTTVGEPIVEFFANDTDGIANDAKVTLTIDEDQSITSVKYLILSDDNTSSYYASDYTNELAVSDATVTGQTYEWVISDVTADSYVAVVAIVDGKAVYKVSSTVSGTEPEESTDSSNFTVSLTLFDADNDGLNNDAKIVIARPSSDATITAKYGTGWSEDDAKEAALSGTEIAIDGDYVLYYIIEKDVISNENIISDEWKYVSVALTISETGKKDSVIYATKQFSRDFNAIWQIQNNDYNKPVWKDSDGDGIYNDIYFNIARWSENDDISNLSLTVTYATADDAETAKAYLNTSNAKTLTTVTGKNFYEFNSTDYPVLKDIGGTDEYGLYFAYRITAGSDNNKPYLDYVTESSSYNGNATVTDISEMNLVANLIALSDDSQANDIYATFSTSLTQTIESIRYATADEDNSSLLKNRVSTEGYYAEIAVSNAKELYRTDSRIYYEVSSETNLAVGTYVALRVQLAESELDSAYKTNTFGPVSETTTTVETTSAPTLSKSNVYFQAFNSDSNYNDIRDSITISIGENQTIKSITGAQASTLDTAKKIASGEEVYTATENQAVTFEVPTEYTLETSVTAQKATLSKVYTFSPSFEDVEDGNYVAIAVVISQTGYEDYTAYITSAKNIISYLNPVTWSYITYTTNAYASQREVTTPSYSVSNLDSNYSQNELVHITIYDDLYNDSLDNYTYKLERTTEQDYDDGDAVWETVEDSITLDSYYNDSYYKSIYYKHESSDSTLNGTAKDIDAETTYVYRLTKTRLASASVTGEAETVVQDENVTPQYNISAPTINFESYKSGALTVISATETYDSNFDYFEKYNYTVLYRVNYENGSTYTSWTTLSDSKVVWTEGTNSSGNATATMLATIDDEISSTYNGTSYNYATLEVELIKEFVDNTSYSATSNTSLNITWNSIATVNSDDEVSLTVNEYSSSYYYFYLSNYSGNTISSYTWYVDGTTNSTSGNSLTLTKSTLSTGSHEVLVIAKTYYGLVYSASATFVVE